MYGMEDSKAVLPVTGIASTEESKEVVITQSPSAALFSGFES